MNRSDREPPRVYTTDDVIDTDDVLTTEDLVEDTSDVLTGGPSGVERRPVPRGGLPELPDEDQEVSTTGSYEVWPQTGQSLDAVGSGMTGDAASGEMDGTGFEDDLDLGR